MNFSALLKSNFKRYAKKLLANMVLFCAACLISLILAEGFIRVFYPQPLVSLGDYHEVFGWRNVPGQTTQHQTRDYKITVNINSKGLRGREYPYKKPDGVSRVLVLGDSFTWGGGVLDNETFPNVLDEMLGKDSEVINAGVNGYGTDQEYLFLTHEGYKYDPDVVVLAFCLNDIENNLLDFDRGGVIPKPRFILNGDTLELINVPVPRPEKQQGKAMALKSFLKSHFHLYAVARDAMYRLKDKFYAGRNKEAPKTKRHLLKLERARRSLGFSNDGEAIFFPFMKEWPDIGKEGWTLTEKIIIRADKFCAKIGARLILMLIPYKNEICENAWMEDLEKYGLKAEDFDLVRPSKVFREFGERNNIETIILTESFKKHKGEELYFKYDRHWNRHGHRLVAREIRSVLDDLEEGGK